MDHNKAAQQVLDAVGGAGNIVSAAHCATRLRLVIADNSKVDKKALEDAEGAKGVFEAQGQLQIIFGTGTVNKVFEAFTALSGVQGGTKEDVKQAAAAKAPLPQRLIKTLGDIFVPIIPAIVASGFLMGIMEALNFMVNNGFLDIDTSGSIYVFAQLFSNTAYTFLPILIGFAAARVFGGNQFLGAVIGMIMIHPDLQNAWTVSEGVQVMQPVFGGLAGGACGALYASMAGLGATGTGVTGIFGVLLCLHAPLQYIISIAIAFGVSFAVTWLIWKPEDAAV